ncbi:chaperone modulator CbpM [Brumimicrobium mesophilum]|uniref:chaperone modulator CbpM n=1 Tax=Brumimicrobium mesophilum TaxID=392717 RepID=UPI000D144520|nr:chaperone modulator CbpM [Brumimicrobium mesophilum]
MEKQKYILIKTLCVQYKVEISFIKELDNIGLIEIEQIEEDEFIHEERIDDLEKMIRLYHELNVNIEGIDIVFNLLQKEIQLKAEIKELQNRLDFYESR